MNLTKNCQKTKPFFTPSHPPNMNAAGYIRKAMVITSHYKYGSVRNNFGDLGGVDAIRTLKMCLEKFEQTGNTEYLLDVANYAMFRFMFPREGEFYKPTDSDGSAGLFGISEKEIERLRNNSWV